MLQLIRKMPSVLRWALLMYRLDSMRTRGSVGSISPGGKGWTPNIGGGGLGTVMEGSIFRSWRYTWGGILRVWRGMWAASSERELTMGVCIRCVDGRSTDSREAYHGRLSS